MPTSLVPAIWLLSAVLFLLIPTTQAQVINVDSTTAEQGAEITLNVSVSQASNLGLLQFGIAFPVDTLEVIEVLPGALGTMTDAEWFSHVTNSTQADEVRVQVAWVFAAGFTGEGNIATLRLRVPEDLAEDVQLRFDLIAAAEASANQDPVNFMTMDGLVSIVIDPSVPISFAIAATGFISNNEFRLTVSGTPDAEATLETSTDLKVWENPVTIQFNSSGLAVLVDTLMQNDTRVFYRVIVP